MRSAKRRATEEAKDEIEATLWEPVKALVGAVKHRHRALGAEIRALVERIIGYGRKEVAGRRRSQERDL